MDPLKCPDCGGYTFTSPCPRCMRLIVDNDRLDYPCRRCPELPWCPDASRYATECSLRTDD